MITEEIQLFSPEFFQETPSTEGIKYIGSKLKLIPYILRLAARVDAKSVFDGFAGSTRVSQAFAKRGYTVTSNDHAVWSKIFASCFLLSKKQPKEYRGLIDHLNNVPPEDGWFTQHYGGDPNSQNGRADSDLKKPWQIQNTRKLDGIRLEIEKLKLEPIDKAVALTSLILALDKVDSTLGHFVSYLREWSPRSYNSLSLKIPDFSVGEQKHNVLHSDIFEALPKVSADLAYYDPPYGSNNEKMPPSRVRYLSYYHVWTSICLFDRPELFGKAKRRADTSDTDACSVFEEFRRNSSGQLLAISAIERLLVETRAKWTILSYSSGGRATAEELNEAIAKCGKVEELMEIDYKQNVMAGMKWTNEWLRDAVKPHREFLFLIRK
jgi:adenine-specific DNA-methyltransferase